jgi:hypothetical protein
MVVQPITRYAAEPMFLMSNHCHKIILFEVIEIFPYKHLNIVCDFIIEMMQVVLTYFKSMTWVIENKTLTPAGKVAVINLKVRSLFFY